jgi:hypothetical protein
MIAKLEAQRAYFASDDHIRREVAAWSDASPEERLAALAEMCTAGAFFLERAEGHEPTAIEDRYPADTLELLAALRRASR